LDVAPEPEPAIVAEVVEPPKLKPKRNKQVKGRMFSGVFGWKPTHIQDIEVPKFKPEDWDENARCMIPAINPHWVWPKKETEYLLRSMIAGDTTLIWGAQGTGKSCLQEQVCALLNIPFWRMSCNKETREQHFTGSAGVSWNDAGQMQITQEPTLLTDSLQYGGVFCEDEAFRHNSALVLQSLREASNRTLILPDAPGRTAEERVLKAPKGRWWYTMTDNTAGIGDETGQFDAEVQDASTLDRIDTTIELGYLTRAQEVKVLKSIAGDDVPVDKLKDMVEVAHLVREGFKSGTMNATLSTRALINWVKKAAVYGEVTTSFRLAWYNKLSRDDQMVASEAFTQATGEYL
jgi:cobaltochelatase CobS